MNVARGDTLGQIFQPIGSAHVRARHKHFSSSFNIQVILHCDSCLISDVLPRTDGQTVWQEIPPRYRVRAQSTSSWRRASRAEAGTLVTAIVSPSALKTSMEYPSVPSGAT